MSLWDKARKALGDVAAAVSKETEILSLHAQLGNLESELERQLIEIGKRARELRAAQRFSDEQIDVLLQRVAEIEAQMMALRQQIAEQQQKSSSSTEHSPPPSAPA